MMMWRQIAFAVFVLFLGAADATCVAADAGIAIDGQVQKPERLTLSNLQALPPTNVTVSFITGHGQEAGTYTGVLLWTLLTNAAIIDADPKQHLRHTILVTSGADQYAVALSIGEIDPKFEGKSVIIVRPLFSNHHIRCLDHCNRVIADLQSEIVDRLIGDG